MEGVKGGLGEGSRDRGIGMGTIRWTNARREGGREGGTHVM